jgi:glycosyltransferase involved in cell wall biosynthesis
MDLKLAIVSHQSFSTLGGISVHIRQLAEALVKLGVDVEVIVPTSRLIRQSPSYPFHVTPIQLNSRLQTIRTLEYSYKVYRYLAERRKRFDAVHGSQTTNFFICRNKEKIKPPVVTKFHGSTLSELLMDLRFDLRYFISSPGEALGIAFTTPIYDYTEAYVLNRSDGVICISKYLAKDIARYISKGKRNIQVIYNGVDTERFKPVRIVSQRFNDEVKIALYVGRIIPRKGLHHLINAMAKSNLSKKLKLLIAGNWNEYPRYSNMLISMIKRYGLEKNVIFLGWVDHNQINTLYNLAHIFVFPSRYETFGNVALEAMACEKPVIVTRDGAFPEFIEHGKTGILMDVNRLEEELVKYLELLTSDESLARKIGRNARKYVVSNLSWEKTALHTIQFITDLISTY